MSFAGFVFDMIRRDKENRDLRNLRKERLNSRLDKYGGSGNRPRNTTAEEMKKIQRQTAKKRKGRVELQYQNDIDHIGDMYSDGFTARAPVYQINT